MPVTSGGGKTKKKGKGRSRSRSGSRGRSNNANLPVTLAMQLHDVMGVPSVTNNQYFNQAHFPRAANVRSSDGIRFANYYRTGPPSPQYLQRYPSFSSSIASSNRISSASNNYNQELEELYAGLPPGLLHQFNNPVMPIRPRSANRPNFNQGAFRRGRPGFNRRSSF